MGLYNSVATFPSLVYETQMSEKLIEFLTFRLMVNFISFMCNEPKVHFYSAKSESRRLS